MAMQVSTYHAAGLEARNGWRMPSSWFVVLLIGLALALFHATSGPIDLLSEDRQPVEDTRSVEVDALLSTPGRSLDDPVAVAVREQAAVLGREQPSWPLCRVANDPTDAILAWPAQLLIVSCP
jgi:hypothetical protein